MNVNYRKGRHNEYRTMRLLEAAGYLCIRAAGSHSPFDVVAISPTDVLLVQCKTNGSLTPAERERMEDIRVPGNVRKFVHRWEDYSRLPRVEEV